MFVVFYRRRINAVLIAILVIYGIGALRRLLTMDDSDAASAIALTLGGLAVIWLATWLWVRYVEARRHGGPRNGHVDDTR